MPRDAPRGPTPVGTLAAVPPLATRTARTAGVVVAALALVAACGTGDAERAASAAPAPTTTTEPPRSVPDPVGGALSAYVPAAEERAADDVGELLVFGDSVAVLLADDLARELDRPLVVDGVDCRRLDLGWIHVKTRVAGSRLAHHAQPLRCGDLRALTMRGLTGGNPAYLGQAQAFRPFFRQAQMAQMHRIEGAAEKSEGACLRPG